MNYPAIPDKRAAFPARSSRRGVPAATLAALGVLGLAVSAFLPAGQESQAAAPKPLQYEVSVVLKLVHVYVTDQKGMPVEDLTRDDFIVTDNGKPVTVTDFEKHLLAPPPAKAEDSQPVAEKPAPKPAAAGETNRKFFLFFDFAFNNARGIGKARKAALHFLDTEVRPEDEIGLMTYSMIRGLTIHEYLTANKAKVREIVGKIGQSDIAGRASEIEDQYWRLVQEPMPGGAISGTQAEFYMREARALREEAKTIAQKFILGLTTLAKALRYVPGQKHFLLFSTGVPSSLIYGNQAGNPSSTMSASSFAGSAGFDAGDRALRTLNEDMYKEFSASGCTFYSFDTRTSAKEADLFAYDKMTFETGGRGMFGQQGIFQTATDRFKDEKTTGANTLKRLTDITGGRYFSNIDMYDRNLDQVQALTGTYYVLGYSISEQWDGQFHEIKVAVKRNGCDVRAQAGYYSPKPYRDYTRLEKDLQLYDLALNERSSFRIPVNFPMTALAYGNAAGAGFEIVARLPGTVTQKLAGEKVEFVTLVFDGQDNIVDIRRLEADPRPHRGQTVIFSAASAVKPGEYTCRLVVRDMASGMSAASSVRTTVSPAPASGLRLGTPLFLVPEGGCAYLEAGGLRAKGAADWRDAYPYDRLVCSPSSGNVPGLTKKVQAVVPFSVPGIVQPELALAVNLIDAATGQRMPVEFTQDGRTDAATEGSVTLGFSTGGLQPGSYILYVNAQDQATGTRAHTQAQLIILPE